MPTQDDYESTIERARARREPILLVVDGSCSLVYESVENAADLLSELFPEPGTMRPDVKDAALTLIAGASNGSQDHLARSAFIAPGYLIRLRRLRRADEVLYALIVEPFRNRDSVRVAARRYSLTKREHETLTLILEGATASEIAHALAISESTVQGYFKRLLKKTNSRNRAAMVANVLEWNRTFVPSQRQAVPDPGDKRVVSNNS